jgi:predicted enzyme related to lactoylglutathione lyase
MKTLLKLGLGLAMMTSVAAPVLAQEASITVGAIRVLANDAEASAKFYEKAFGMSETRRPVDTATFKEIIVNTGSTSAKAKTAKSTPIVIATKRDKAAPVPSMAALIVYVPNMDKAIAAVVAAGGKSCKPATSGEKLTYCMSADPDGNPIELLLNDAILRSVEK